VDSSQVSSTLANRSDKPREYQFSRERSMFFCGTQSGQCLPGETVNTVFSFCCKSSGGVFSQQWLLETVPKASVTLMHGCDAKIEAPSRSVSRSGVPLSTDGPSAIVARAPTSVSVNLRGHIYTHDHSQHRRQAEFENTERNVFMELLRDDVYSSIHKIRTPVTEDMINSRKIQLFLETNSNLVIDESNTLLFNRNDIYLPFTTFLQFIELSECVTEYYNLMMSKVYHLQEHIATGEDALTMKENIMKDVILQKSIDTQKLRDKIFPEKELVIVFN
jgi:hypothetical protein